MIKKNGVKLNSKYFSSLQKLALFKKTFISRKRFLSKEYVCIAQ